jgi:hypothetical protein
MPFFHVAIAPKTRVGLCVPLDSRAADDKQTEYTTRPLQSVQRLEATRSL